jgi:hypothetical protein
MSFARRSSRVPLLFQLVVLHHDNPAGAGGRRLLQHAPQAQRPGVFVQNHPQIDEGIRDSSVQTTLPLW